MDNKATNTNETKRKWNLIEVILYCISFALPFLLIGLLFANVFSISETANDVNSIVYYSILDMGKNDTVKMLGITFIVLNSVGLILSALNSIFFIKKSDSYFRYLPIIVLFFNFSILTFISFIFKFVVYGTFGTFSLLIIAGLFLITYRYDNNRFEKQNENEEEQPEI